MSGFAIPRLCAATAAVCATATVTLLALGQPLAGVVGCFAVILAIIAVDQDRRERDELEADRLAARAELRERTYRRMAALMVLPPYDQGETPESEVAS
jgi:hypothetical protein